MKLPATLDPASVTVLIDTREQQPWDVSPMNATSGSLATGDYTLEGFPPTYVAIERKASIQELVSCVGTDRDRFQRELDRLKAFDHRLVIIEASWSDVCEGAWRGKLSVSQVKNTLLSWQSRGIPFLFASTRAEAEQCAKTVLYLAARRFYRSARDLFG